MSLARIRKPTLIVLSLLLALAVLSLAPQPAAPTPGDNAVALKAPSFVRSARAQAAPDASPMGFPQDEAGISAYFKSASPVTLADVRSVYRVIETETADYIIGSVQVPEYEEVYDVHLYVHRDGWFLAYYLSPDPTGKILDWKQYVGGTIETKLERVLAIAAVATGVAFPGCTYYDFRYPNATQAMFIAEDQANGSDFTVKVPGAYAVYERSWALASLWSGKWVLDGTTIKSQDLGRWSYSEGALAASQFLPDVTHTIRIDCNNTCYGGFTLTYRVP